METNGMGRGAVWWGGIWWGGLDLSATACGSVTAFGTVCRKCVSRSYTRCLCACVSVTCVSVSLCQCANVPVSIVRKASYSTRGAYATLPVWPHASEDRCSRRRASCNGSVRPLKGKTLSCKGVHPWSPCVRVSICADRGSQIVHLPGTSQMWSSFLEWQADRLVTSTHAPAQISAFSHARVTWLLHAC